MKNLLIGSFIYGTFYAACVAGLGFIKGSILFGVGTVATFALVAMGYKGD